MMNINGGLLNKPVTLHPILVMDVVVACGVPNGLPGKPGQGRAEWGRAG